MRNSTASAWHRQSLVAVLLAALLALCMALPGQAQAAANAYTVKFNSNGGSGSMSSQSINRDKSVKLKGNSFKRSAYVFTGWNTKKDGKGKAYKDKASVKNLAAKGKTVTLYAQWRKGKAYTVKFNANGGTGTTKSQSITYNKATALTANGFAREDESFTYAFAGWNTKADGSGKAYQNKASVTNLAAEGKTATLYAQWRATNYLVRFDANGAEGTTAAQKITVGKSAKLRACGYTRAGWRFAGWNTEADGLGEEFDNKEVILDDLAGAGKALTLYAQWEPTTYTVAFDANGGTGSMTARPVTAGKAFRLPGNAFARAGFVFEGWATEADGSGVWCADREVVVDDLADAGGNVILYAQWKAVEEPKPAPEPITYAVTFDANGGTGSMESQTAKEGTAFRLKKCSLMREGWEFVGWNTASDGRGDSFRDREAILPGELLVVDGEAVLYAQWRELPKEPVAVTYAISYEANGGTGNMSTQTATVGQAVKLLRCAFTRAGWEFVGWTTTSDGTGIVLRDAEVLLDDFSEDVTLYAQWKELPQVPATFTVVFDANDSTGEMDPLTATEGKSLRLTACAFVREGYTFAGWNTMANGDGASFRDREAILAGELTPTDGTVTLYAQWNELPKPAEPETHTITFDANGGEGVMESQVVAAGKVYRLTRGAFTRDMFEFAGWNTKPDGTGVAYEDRGVIDQSLLEEASPTLYAQWEGTAVKFVFDPNGGEGDPSEIVYAKEDYSYDSDKQISFGLQVPHFTREGYVLVGYAQDAAAIDPDEDLDFRKFVEYEDCHCVAEYGMTVRLYAVWSPACTFVFDTRGEDLSLAPITVGASAYLRDITRNAYDEPSDYSMHRAYISFTGNNGETRYKYVSYWSLDPEGTVRYPNAIKKYWRETGEEAVYEETEEYYNGTRNATFAEQFGEGVTSVTLYAHWVETGDSDFMYW